MRTQKLRICKHCKKEYTTGTLKDQCTQCYNKIYEHGSFDPEKWHKTCQNCGAKHFSKIYNKKYCEPCKKKLRLDRNYKKYRKDHGIDLNLPKKEKKKNGEGHTSKHGYRYLTKVGHPNAGRFGRILEHIYIMSNHLGRPMKKGETIHHINGIRDDNRIENLEIWHRLHPPGQRLDEKLKWAKEFLEEYGYKIIC